MDSTNSMNRVYGSGMRLPKPFDRRSTQVATRSGVDKINQNIHHILSTRIGDRFFLPEFGSKLHTLIFDGNIYVTRDLASVYTREALEKWEPRITVIDIQVGGSSLETDNYTMPIHITYSIKQSGEVVSYDYPWSI